MFYYPPKVQTKAFNLSSLNQYTAEDIEGTFNITFDPDVVLDECEAFGIPLVDVVTLVFTPTGEFSVDYTLSHFPFLIPLNPGTGTINGSQFTGTIISTFHLEPDGEMCDYKSTFTLTFDILGPQEISDAFGSFEISVTSGDLDLCIPNNSGSTSGSCRLQYNLPVNE